VFHIVSHLTKWGGPPVRVRPPGRTFLPVRIILSAVHLAPLRPPAGFRLAALLLGVSRLRPRPQPAHHRRPSSARSRASPGVSHRRPRVSGSETSTLLPLDRLQLRCLRQFLPSPVPPRNYRSDKFRIT